MNKVFYNIFFLLFQECVIDIENGIFPATKTLVPGTTLTGSCNSGYIALSGQIEVTIQQLSLIHAGWVSSLICFLVV